MLSALKQELNYTTTKNQAIALKSTTNSLLDFFASSGALRGNPTEFVDRFVKAYLEDPIKAAQLLFYARDIRGGQGERDNFRAAFFALAKLNPSMIKKLIEFVPMYGRWDDMFVLSDSNLYLDVQLTMLDIVVEQFELDWENYSQGNPISLLAKWLPSEPYRGVGRSAFLKDFLTTAELTGKEYRTKLVALRKHLDIVETKMSANQWDQIDYSKVPSQALGRYIPAFYKQDQSRFDEWMNDKSTKKNVSTLTPPEIIRAIVGEGGSIDAYTTLWDALPPVGDDSNTMVVADVSGSMTWGMGLLMAPIFVAISLAMFFAQHNTGAFHNHFMTFSEEPELVKIQGQNLLEKYLSVGRANWGMNTNLEAVFDVLADAIIHQNIPTEDWPARLVIISDMEFDSAISHTSRTTLLESIKGKWRDRGLGELPDIVFWNVNSKRTQFPAAADDEGVALVSGYSPSILSMVLEGEDLSPFGLMEDVLSSDRYKPIAQILDR